MIRLGGTEQARRATIVSVLDIGTTKVVCLIARMKPVEGGKYLASRTHRAEVIGIGHQMAHGIKSGLIVDLQAAEQSIRMAVDAAERMAGVTVESLIVNVSAGRLKSSAANATVNLGGQEVQADDMRRVLRAGLQNALRHERQVLHVLPVSHSLDGEKGIRDPLGMVGSELGVTMHVLSAEAAPLRNIELCVNRAHLSVETLVATPYASGLAALVEDEIELGCACIDMGGGTTSIAVFNDGRFVHADAIAVGGHHITMDIARGLSTRIEMAEKLKVIQASAVAVETDDQDIITVPPLADDDRDVPLQAPRALLNRIVKARLEETLELLRDRLNASGYSGVVGKRVVLTGGAAQLTGMTELARRILGRKVRLGRPLGVAGLPASAKGPAFSAAVGLMIYPQVAGNEQAALKTGRTFQATGTNGPLQRVGQWLRESF